MSTPNPDIFTPKPPRRRGTVPVRLPSFSPNDFSASRGPDPSSTFHPPHAELQPAQQQYIPIPQSAPIPPFPPPFPHYFLPNSQTPVYRYVAPQGYPVAVPGKSLSEPRARIGRERRSRNPERHRIREESLNVESRARSRSSSSSDSGRDSPPRRHHFRHSSRYSASDSDEDFGSSTLYSFTPSRISRGVSAKDPGAVSGDVEDEDVAPQEKSHDIIGAPSVSHVFESQYIGDGVREGHHAARLSVVDGKNMKYHPLFRWFHIKPRGSRPMLDFEHFSREVFRIESLSTGEKMAAAKMFSKLGNDNFRSMQFSDGRDVHRMKPSYLRGEIPADSQYKGTQARTLHWIALPYFSVEPYSGLEAGAGSASAVPAPTLLQSQFSHVAKSRDLKQAVCGIGNNLQQEVCLHVPQLWCLIFDNALIVTYINLPDKYFPGDFVINTTGSLDALAGVSRTKKILVCFGTCVMWSIPLHECQTWFALTSRFSEFWPQKFELLHNKRKITAKDWPAIWDRARHVKNYVKLELYLGARIMAPQRGRLLPDIASKGKGNIQSSTSSAHEDTSTKPGPAGDGVSSSATVETTDGRFTNANGFAIFTCMTGVSTPNSDDSVEDALLEQLVEIRDWLLYMPSFGDAKAYKSCTKDTRASVRRYMEKRAAELSSVESQGRKDQRAQRDFEDRIDIFNAAETIFAFFLPLDFDGPTVRRYWGAVRTIIGEKREDQHRYQASMYTIRHQLRMQALDLSQLSEILSAAHGADRAQITVPTQIIDAWIHLLLGLASFPRDSDRSERLIGDARRAATEGANIIITSLSPKSLVENSVILPLEIFSLISLKVIQSAPNVPDSPSNKEKANTYSDVAQIYRNRLDKIETDISKRPSDRANEENLKLVGEEIQAILQTLLQQYVIFSLLLENANHAIDNTTTFKEKPIVQAAGHSRSMPVFIQSWSRDREPGYRSHQHRETEVRALEYGREHSKFDMYDNPFAFDLASEDSLFKVKPTDPGGYRKLLLLECHSKTDLLKQEFHQLGARCANLRAMSQYGADTTKFRQDKAIYAFTIVTVIFLPLSAISSIFGMNTADIRDMENSQWIYWATAIPVTLAVILFGLYWMGELGNTFKWVFWSLGSWMFRKVAGDREKGREIVDRWFGQTDPVPLGLPSHIQPAYPIGPERRPTYHPGRPARSVSSDESVDIRYRNMFG